MADDILRIYDLETQYPTVWHEGTHAMETGGNTPGAETTPLSRDNTPAQGGYFTSKDDKDPLGVYSSIAKVLREEGISADSDSKEQAKYMLSSTKFNPNAFLHQVHKNTPYETLKSSIGLLRRAIKEQDSGGKGLLDDDHEKFVNAKRRLDNVMMQLQKSGVLDNTGPINTLSKNVDESIKMVTMLTRPLEQLSAERARIQVALRLVTEFRYLFDLPRTLKRFIAAEDHHEFVRARKRGLGELSGLLIPGTPPEVVTVGKLLQKPIDDAVDVYRQILWKKLTEASHESDYFGLLEKLSDLSVSKNPAFEWMTCQAAKYRHDIETFFVEIKHETSIIAADSMVQYDTPLPQLLEFIKRLDTAKQIAITGSDVCHETELDHIENVRMWHHIVNEISEFSHIVDGACSFWRECSHLLSGWKLENTSKLSNTEQAQVQEQFMNLVKLMGEQLTEWLSSPSQPSQDLPVAAAHESKRLGDSLAFIPLSSNSLCTCSFLVDVLDSLQYVSVSLCELLGSSNSFTLSLRNARILIVKAACACWIRDSSNLNLHGDWSESSLPTLRSMSSYFAAYHIWILRKLQCMLDPSGSDNSEILDIINSSLRQALTASLRMFHDESSESGGSADPVPTSDSLLSPPKLDPDDQILITLKSLHQLQTEHLELIFTEYRTCFLLKETLTLQRESAKQVHEMQDSLFGLYIWEQKTYLDRIISSGISKKFESTMKTEAPTSISGYIYESLMTLSSVHSKLSDFVPQLLQPALEKLTEHLLKAIRTGIRTLDRLSAGYSLQQVANTDFLRKMLKQYMTTACKDVVRGIHESLKENTIDPKIWTRKNTVHEMVGDIVTLAAQEDKLAYNCFRTVNVAS